MMYRFPHLISQSWYHPILSGRCGNQGPQRSSLFPKVSQRASVRSGIQVQATLCDTASERPSQQRRSRPSPARKPDSKHQRPNRTAVPPLNCHISLTEQCPSPWHDILAFPKSGLFPAAPLTHHTHSQGPPCSSCLQPFAEAVLTNLANAHTAPHAW